MSYLAIWKNKVSLRIPSALLSVQFLSYSWSFRQKSSQIIGFLLQIQRFAPPPIWGILDPPLWIESWQQNIIIINCTKTPFILVGYWLFNCSQYLGHIQAIVFVVMIYMGYRLLRQGQYKISNLNLNLKWNLSLKVNTLWTCEVFTQ